jgi:hypothetical protein
MYSISSALTVFQSRRSSRATSRTVPSRPDSDGRRRRRTAWWRRGCWPTGAASPVSRRRSSGSARPDLDLQVHPGVATGEVAYSTDLAIVERSLSLPTRSTGRFFPRRRSRKIRALGSPAGSRETGTSHRAGVVFASAHHAGNLTTRRRRKPWKSRGSEALTGDFLPTRLGEEPALLHCSSSQGVWDVNSGILDGLVLPL